MRVKNVWPAQNFVLYVEAEEGYVLKYSMLTLVEEDNEFYKLKYFPDQFIAARPENCGRSIAWGDDTLLDARIVQEQGKPVNIGFLTLHSVDELELLEKHSSEPIVKQALESRYGNMIFLENGLFSALYDWLVEMCTYYLYCDSKGQYHDTKESSLFDAMALEMWRP